VVEESSVKAIILAAGEGTRLRPFTDSVPKGMIFLANKPILSYVVESLVSAGITEIVMVVGYQKERIMDYFGDGNHVGAHITYVFQERQLGTGHALLQAAQLFGNQTYVVPADNIVNEQMIKSIRNQTAPGLLCVLHDESSKYGVVRIENNLLTQICEKPEMNQGNIISTGIYKFTKDVIPLLRQTVQDGKTDLTDTIKAMISQGLNIHATISNEHWQDVVYPWDIVSVNEFIMQQQTSTQCSGTIEKGVVIQGAVTIGKNSVIRSGSYLLGPVCIGDGCHIGPYTCVFPSTAIGDNVSIGPFSKIQNCVINSNTTIDSHCSLRQSILGESCVLDSHVVILHADADIRLDTTSQFLHVQNSGAYIGENTRMHAGVIIHPGVIIGSNTTIHPQKIITNSVKANSLVV
jgi:glucose-1-phosphate thymidylyltransferase